MAQNLHRNLPDREIHAPKGFVTATSSSVLSKSLTNEIEWAGSNYSVQTLITCTDDVSGITGGRYFLLPLKDATYQVWFDVDNNDSCLINSGNTELEVDISSGDTATAIATALKTKLATISGVSATSASGVVTATISSSAVSVSAAQDGPSGQNTGYKFVSSKTHVGNEYLTTDSSGNIEWISKPAVVTNTNYFYHHIGGTCTPKGSAVNNYLVDKDGAGTKIRFVHTLGTTMPSSILPSLMTGYGAFIAPRNCVLGDVQYSISHTHSSTHANVEMHLLKITPASGTSLKNLTWVGGVTAVATTFSLVDDEVKFGHFAMGNPLATSLTQGDIIIPVIKSDLVAEHHFSMGLHFIYV